MLLAAVWVWLGPTLRSELGLSGPPIPDRGDQLRVVTWNLANFRGDAEEHDLARMREVIEELDPDVLALQEVRSPDALRELLPGWELVVSDRGGRGHQRLAIAWRSDRVRSLAEPREHSQLSLGGRVRPGLSAYLRGRSGGPDFAVLVVHLKAMPDGIDQRRRQWPVLLDLAAELAATTGDRDLIVLGDFNSTGAPGQGPADEQRELTEHLSAAALRRLPNASGCSAYYDGRRRDAWKEPSEIDLVWIRELDEALGSEAQVVSGAHCQRYACRDFRSTQAYPVRDYERVSDHCPVVLDLARRDDD